MMLELKLYTHSCDSERLWETLQQNCRPLKPFDKNIRHFLNAFAKSILLDRSARDFPELISLANYFKSKNLETIIPVESQDYVLRARGTAFHLAPSNVDTVFLYSSLLSLLCGNRCLIRISRNLTEQVSFALDKINTLLTGDYDYIREFLYIFTYEHDDKITEKLSLISHSRVIWGGDETVAKIRKIPLNPLANELVFPNRFSLTILDSSVVNDESQDLCKAVTNFIKDSAPFDQQACSSPKLVVWIGSEASVIHAQKRFWRTYKELQSKQSLEDKSEGAIMDEFVLKSYLLGCGKSNTHLDKKNSNVIELKEFPADYTKLLHPGNGLFYQLRVPTLHHLADDLAENDQTISYYGLSKDDILHFIQNLPARAVDRIVPLGESLDFYHIWDGVNFLDEFTLKTVVR